MTVFCMHIFFLHARLTVMRSTLLPSAALLTKCLYLFCRNNVSFVLHLLVQMSDQPSCCYIVLGLLSNVHYLPYRESNVIIMCALWILKHAISSHYVLVLSCWRQYINRDLEMPDQAKLMDACFFSQSLTFMKCFSHLSNWLKYMILCCGCICF